MQYKIIIEGRFASLNEFIDANRRSRGKWQKGNSMKQNDQNNICFQIKKQHKNLHIDKPVKLHYTFYERDMRRDLDNVSGYFHKIFQDSLVHCGILKNDNWKYIKGFSDNFVVYSKRPRIEIVIEVIGND